MTDERQAEATFADWVRRRHGFKPEEIVRRPEPVARDPFVDDLRDQRGEPPSPRQTPR